MGLKILTPGLLTTVQDLGRYGYAHLGVSPAGAADALALRVGNLLLGNDENAPALEMTLLGATVEFERAALVALTGGDVECRLGRAKAPMWKLFPVMPGAVLKCGGIINGARSYLAVQGGLDVAPVMGSASTLRSAHIGGIDGRGLVAGDRIGVAHAAAPMPVRHLSQGAISFLKHRSELRITTGPQASWFGESGFETLQRAPYIVSGDSDRRGVRFQGEALRLPGKQLLSEGISLGAMQVPQDGQPIVLFVDQQTTGGYPKIANVIAADLRHLGQLRPREQVRFRLVTQGEALAALREQENWLCNALQPGV